MDLNLKENGTGKKSRFSMSEVFRVLLEIQRKRSFVEARTRLARAFLSCPIKVQT